MQSILTPQRLLILVIVLLAISSIQPGSRANGIARPFRGLAELFAAPIRVPLQGLGALRDAGPRDLDIPDLTHPGYTYQRIAELETRIDKLEEDNRRLRGVRSIIGERASPPALVDARVTAVTGPRDTPILRIDRGTTSGVTNGCIVVTYFHLVGEVTTTDLMTAQVKPITAARSKVLARLMEPGTETLREGSGIWLEWSPDDQAFVQQISSSVNVQEGDYAVFADEGSLPDALGYFLGQVTAVRDYKPDPYSFNEVVVRPTYRLDQLRQVTVLVPIEEE